jgi:hypothetical protein
MQELQCVDCILNFLETEIDTNIRDRVFDLLFGDIYNEVSNKFILQLLLSYAISLGADKTLDCISKWILLNIGNEIMENLFDQLVKDHFLLMDTKSDDPMNGPQDYLTVLADKSPIFASLFMTLILDMISNNILTNREKSLKKLFQLFELWIDINPMLPLLAFKSNLSHTSSYMLNPVPGFLYITVVYPLKNALECMEMHRFNKDIQVSTIEQEIEQNKVFLDEKRSLCEQMATSLDELANKVHLISLKLIKDLQKR